MPAFRLSNLVASIHRTAILAATSAVVLWAQAARADDDVRIQTGIDASNVAPVLQQIIDQWPLPGLAVAIVTRDTVLYEGGFGERIVGGERDPVDANTIFRINSMAKAMGATLIGMLSDDGVMRFDEPVTTHLPWFRVEDAWVSQELRINDLLTHRTGLFCNDWLDDAPHVTWEEGVRRLRFMQQVAPLRAEFAYCDWVYGAAGLAIANAAGGWDHALKTRLLEPLEMRRTFTEIEEVIDSRGLTACHECEPVGPPVDPGSVIKVPNVAVPHVDVNGVLRPTVWRRMPSRGGSSVLSSAHDVGRFLQLYLRDGKVKERQLISSAALRAILQARIVTRIDRTPPDLPGFRAEHRRARFLDAGYGYGWRVGRYDDERVFSHGGNSVGFESLMVLLPDRGVAFVVLVNYSHDNRGGVDAAAMTVLDRVLDLPPLDWTGFHRARTLQQVVDLEAQRARLLSSPETKPSATIVANLAGSYCSQAYGIVNVRRERDGGLRLDQGPERWGTLSQRADGSVLLRWNGIRNALSPVTFKPASGSPARTVTIKGSEFERCAGSPLNNHRQPERQT